MDHAASTSLPREIEIFLDLRDLLYANPCAGEFDSDTLASLLWQERYCACRVEAHEVEQARGALLTDDEVHA